MQDNAHFSAYSILPSPFGSTGSEGMERDLKPSLGNKFTFLTRGQRKEPHSSPCPKLAPLTEGYGEVTAVLRKQHSHYPTMWSLSGPTAC